MEHNRNDVIANAGESGCDCWKIPMSTLSGIIQEGHSSTNLLLNEGRDIEGLLFGKSSTSYHSEHSDQSHRAKLSSKKTCVVMSYLATGSCCSFYSSSGSIDVQKVSALIQTHKRTDISLIGIFVLRKATPLKPSVRERTVMDDLYEKVLKQREHEGFNPALLVLSSCYQGAKQDSNIDPTFISFQYRLFTGRSLVATTFSVPNLGGQLTAYEQLFPLDCGKLDFNPFAFGSLIEDDPDPVNASVEHVEGLCQKKLAQIRDLLEKIQEKEEEIRAKLETLQQKRKEQQQQQEQQRTSTDTSSANTFALVAPPNPMTSINTAMAIEKSILEKAPPISMTTPPPYPRPNNKYPTDKIQQQQEDNTESAGSSSLSLSPTY